MLLGARAHAGSPVTILVDVRQAPVAWADPNIYDKLETILSREIGFRVVRVGEGQEGLAAFPDDRNNLDSLTNWAREAGGRYLLVLTVASERLTRRKTFDLPLIFHQYRTIGVIEGELRLIDVTRGRMQLAEPFRTQLKGPRIFQGMPDGDINDPDIHLTAAEKLVFMDQLEGKLAARVAKRVIKAIRKR
jgi:hypothetical protein